MTNRHELADSEESSPRCFSKAGGPEPQPIDGIDVMTIALPFHSWTPAGAQLLDTFDSSIPARRLAAYYSQHVDTLDFRRQR